MLDIDIAAEVFDRVNGNGLKLHEAEQEALQMDHTDAGASLAERWRMPEVILDVIRHHHEKLDGSGYPDSLEGDEVTPLVRILAVADIYDALTTDRPYRDRYSKEKAFSILRDLKDQGKIDPDIVEIFIETQG